MKHLPVEILVFVTAVLFITVMYKLASQDIYNDCVVRAYSKEERDKCK